MEDLTLALITLTSFVLLFVVAIFADRAGMENEHHGAEPVLVPIDDMTPTAERGSIPRLDADVA
jgi:hypothetical protein